MANNGWAKLGEALAGTSPAQRADIEAKTIQALAGRDRAMAGARMDIEKARALDGLGSYLTQLGIEYGEAVAGTQRAGVNLNTLYGGLGKRQHDLKEDGSVSSAIHDDGFRKRIRQSAEEIS